MWGEQVDSKMQQVVDRVRGELLREMQKPFIVSVMGTTGTGKSSLINALFGTALATDAVQPCTKIVETVPVDGTEGSQLLFHDMPGIGEAGDVDENYIGQYRTKLLESDVVLWAIHADSRSVSFDQAALNRILGTDPAERVALMSKLTFVLTKADLLMPEPWIFAKNGDRGVFATASGTARLLAEKESYFQKSFILPHAADIRSTTHLEGAFDVREPGFTVDEYFVHYRGILTEPAAEALKAKYPRHADVFQRLADNYRVISCSSRFRYNLAQLMFVIVNKLGPEASARFQRFIRDESLNEIDVAVAKQFCNMVVFDQRRRKVVFTMADQKL